MTKLHETLSGPLPPRRWFYNKQEEGGFWTAFLWGCCLTLGTTLLFLIPEILFPYITGVELFAFFKRQHYQLLIFCMFMSAAGSQMLRTWFILIITILIAIWLGSLAFFGDVITPAQIYQIPLQYYEITETMFSVDSLIIVPVIMLVLLSGIAVWFLQNKWLSKHVFRFGLLGNFVAISGFVFLIYFAATTNRITRVYPTAIMNSFVGPINAFSVAMRLKYLNSALALDESQVPQIVATHDLGLEPITVVVIMGESINPRRLGIIDPAHKTTPRLDSILANAANKNHSFTTKLGFSHGVSTFGSVPGFIRMDDATNKGRSKILSLGAIAKNNGFATALVSSQRKKLTEMTGLPAQVDFVHDSYQSTPRQRAQRDDTLVEILESKPISAPREFYFIHQRVNHGPYLKNCRHVPEFVQAAKKIEKGRLQSYDLGLKCYDRNTAALIKHFMDREGTVHIFITADHNELMGEKGLWGHSIPKLMGSLVGVMLFSNQPDSPIVKDFSQLVRPSGYEFSRLVAKALGSEVRVPAYDPDTFYVNNSSPFAEGGYMVVKRLGNDVYKVSHRLVDDKVHNEETVDFGEFNLPN